MASFQGMTIEEALKSEPVLKTADLEQILKRSSRTLCRWQDEDLFENPMPKPFSACRNSGNNYDSGKILAWFQSLPLRKKKQTLVR
ncbi:hypothetical protein [Acinetobacter beijerinckii]|uniref:hypothetical protein n=1 Tax=Acinetobacter beijerinckii TaxID=262668 RepID=UPI00240707E6|nr:hypothetical protein [Acinetobacter beijerinckii]